MTDFVTPASTTGPTDHLPRPALTVTIARRRPGDTAFPEVRVDGVVVPVGWGDNLVCTTPGRHVLTISEAQFWDVGLVSEEIELGPDQHLALSYVCGAVGWGHARLTTSAPRIPPPWVRWGVAAGAVVATAAAVYAGLGR